jgi:hypothetical protein
MKNKTTKNVFTAPNYKGFKSMKRKPIKKAV